VATLQPQAPPTHAVPSRLPVQSAHRPDPPHAVPLVPGSHFPAPQQPARHGSAGNEQEKMHTPVVLSHPALTGGHSAAIEHPQVPPPATGWHTAPPVPALNTTGQDAQSRPLYPQPVFRAPLWHVPLSEPSGAPAQQPPLHGCVPAHVSVHRDVFVSQAWPRGQSLALVHS
jgi:hypothetical protein